MQIGHVDLSRQVLVVAEIGNNHEGSPALAEELVGLAVKAGADAVKFQTFRTEHLVSRRDAARFERMRRFELPMPVFERLSRQAQEAGVLFLSTPFDLESARALEPIVSAYKIASGDNTFYPLLEQVAARDKPLLVSTRAS
ncbi:MAG: N-acetylneuraminate synthase family protein [Planctomycetota bacterium]|jgi:sialic acid synthase SpsE